VTIDTLEQYYGLASNIDAITEEIDTLYNPVRSPVGNGTHSNEPSDPTGRSAMRIIQLKDMLEADKAKQLELAEQIEHWLMTVKDSEVVSIIRWHYILHYNWKATNAKVYGYPDYHYSRRKVIRYFEKEAKKVKDNAV